MKNRNNFPNHYIWQSIKYLLVAALYASIALGAAWVVINAFLGIEHISFMALMIICGICALVGTIFSYFFSYRQDDYLEAYAMGDVWVKRTQIKKPRNGAAVQLQLLPYLVIVGICIYMFIVHFEEISMYDTGELFTDLFVFGYSILFVVYTFFRWVQLARFCSRGTCKKCGAIFGWLREGVGTTQTKNSVDIKVGSRTDYVETVETEDEIIDYYRTTPVVQARQVSTSSNSYQCRCAFCGNSKSFFVSHTHYGNWKKL